MNQNDPLAQLSAESANLRRENESLRRENARLAARVHELEARLQGANSGALAATAAAIPEVEQLTTRLREVRRSVLAHTLTVPPSSPIPEDMRQLSALHLSRFYDAFADYITDGNTEAFNARREPLRRALLDSGLPSEVAIDLDRVIAQELLKELPEYASTIRTRLVRSQMLITETNIKRYFERSES